MSQLKARDVDAGIARLNRLLSTSSGIERVLSFLYYLCTLLAPQLSRASLLLTIKLPTPVPLLALTPASATLATTSTRLRRLAAKISDVRMFLRLWGLVGMYSWGKDTLHNPPKDAVEQALVLGQVAVNVAYQVMENVAYLSSQKILGIEKRVQARLWLWSTRCWFAHIVLEFLRLERVRSRREGKKSLLTSREEEKTAAENWWKAWITNAANAPLSIHWSLADGLISDTAVGAFGTVGAVISLRDAWNKCA